MDWTDEPVAGGGTCDKFHLTSSADIEEVPRDNRKVEDEGFLPILRRTANPTHLSRLNRLDSLWLTTTDDEKTQILTPSRSSSCSSEEIVFRGRANHRRAISIERVSEALSGLSMAENEEKNAVGPKNGKLLNLLDDRSACQEDKTQSKSASDVRCLISKRMRPSPSEEVEAEQDDPYRGINLNEGWNRASFRGIKGRFAEKPLLSNIKVWSDFAGYSLRAQQLLKPVRPDLERFFTFVFKSTGPVNRPFHTCRSLVLSRRTTLPVNNSPPALRNPPFEYAPGLFTVPLHLFDCPPETISNVCLYICRQGLQQSNPKRRVHEAQLSQPELAGKRQCLHLGGRHVYHHNPYLAPRAKRIKLALNDEWRKRMRSRAVKGGRWTDGTVRQGRLWAEFHWVLDGEVSGDPLEQKRAFQVDIK